MISKLSVFLLAAFIGIGLSYCFYDPLVLGTNVDPINPEPLQASVPMVDGSTAADPVPPRELILTMRKLIPENWSIRVESYKTGRTAGELESFYNDERMTAAGWKPVGPCLGEGEHTSLSRRGVCLYTWTKSPSRECLAMYVVEDPQEKETYIFYMRFDVVEPSGKLGELLNRNG